MLYTPNATPEMWMPIPASWREDNEVLLQLSSWHLQYDVKYQIFNIATDTCSLCLHRYQQQLQAYKAKCTALTGLTTKLLFVLQRRSQATNLEMFKWTVRLEATRRLPLPVTGDGLACPTEFLKNESYQ